MIFPNNTVPDPALIRRAAVLIREGKLVMGEVLGLPRPTTPLKIIRRRDKECGRGADPAGDQRGIVDLADTNLKIDSLFDEIAQPVVQDEVDRQFVMLLQQRIEFAAEIKSKRDRNA